MLHRIISTKRPLHFKFGTIKKIQKQKKRVENWILKLGQHLRVEENQILEAKERRKSN